MCQSAAILSLPISVTMWKAMEGRRGNLSAGFKKDWHMCSSQRQLRTRPLNHDDASRLDRKPAIVFGATRQMLGYNKTAAKGWNAYAGVQPVRSNIPDLVAVSRFNFVKAKMSAGTRRFSTPCYQESSATYIISSVKFRALYLA